MTVLTDEQKPDPVECPNCAEMAGWVDWAIEDIETVVGTRGVPAGDKYRCADCGNLIKEWW